MTRVDCVSKVMAAEIDKPYSLGGLNGSTDCLIMGLRVVDALHGSNFAFEAIGAYKTQRDIAKTLRKRGYKGFADIFASRLGLEEKPAGMAYMGDIAVVEIDGKEHVAVFTGQRFTTITDTGAVSYDAGFVKSCFKV